MSDSAWQEQCVTGAGAASSNRGRVLVVDDEAMIRDCLTHTLSRNGMEVSTFAAAEEALEAVARQFFDLCFLDLRLPGMDGVEAMAAIRRASPKTQIAIMTASLLGHAEEAEILRAADFFLPKPFDLDQARQIATQVLGVSRATPET